MARQKPNLVLFNPDQWRGDTLGHMGHPAVQTPRLDALVAEDAVSFRHAFCQNPVCTPSRCSFMTGLYPHTLGHRTMYHMLRPHERHLLQVLREEGYFLWWAGKNDLFPGEDAPERYVDIRAALPGKTWFNAHDENAAWRGDPGSDTYYSFHIGRIDVEPEDGIFPDADARCIARAVEFIHAYQGEQPFCLFLSLGYPHPPYGVEEPYFSLTDRAKVPPRIPTPPDGTGKPSILEGIRQGQGMQSWSEGRWQELRATYCGMCARVDAQAGMVLDALRTAGHYDDTAFLLFSDHGDFTGDYGLVEKTQNTFEDCLTRVPFLIKPPRGVPVRPRVSEALVELVDVPATVYDLVGVRDPGYTHFGRSLLPVLAGDTDTHRDAVFCEGGRLQGEEHCKETGSTSAGNPKGLYYPRVRMQMRDDPAHTAAIMCRTARYKYVRRLYEEDELYDLRADPSEQQNRIHDPALASVLAALKDRLCSHYLETASVVPYAPDARNLPPTVNQVPPGGASAQSSSGG